MSIRFIDYYNRNKLSQYGIECTIGSIPKSDKHRKYLIRSIEQKPFIRLCAEWVALNMFPMTIVEHTCFRYLMEYSNYLYHDVSRMTIRRKLTNLGSKIKQIHQSFFSTVTFFCHNQRMDRRKLGFICIFYFVIH